MARPAAVLTVLALLAAGLTAPTSAVAVPTPERAAAAPKVNGIFTLTAQPEQLVAARDGNMWVVLSGSGTGDDLAKVAPNGAVTYYDVLPTGLGALAPLGGNLWSTTTNGIVKIPLADPTTATVTPDPDITDPRGIAVGPDGLLWAASGDRIVHWSPAAPADAEAQTVTGMSAREVVATKNRVWVVDNAGAILTFDPANPAGIVTKGVGGTPQGLGAGPGDQVIYTNPGTDPQTVGILTPTSNPRLTDVPGADPSFSAAYGADSGYWVGLFNEQRMLRVPPRGPVERMFTFPDPYKPRHVARGPGGTIWVSLQDPGSPGALARITGVRDTAVSIGLLSRPVPIRRSNAKVRLACPAVEFSGPCRGAVFLRAPAKGRVVRRQKAYTVRAGEEGVVSIYLPYWFKRQIPRSRMVRMTINVRDAAGNERQVVRRVRLVR